MLKRLLFVTAFLPMAWGQSWTPPKTPWGDPDLQGMWPGNMGVPMQRPEALGTRTTLTDEEFAQRQAQAKRQAAADSESTAASDSTPGIGPPSYWTERGTPTRQTSLIIDPPNGRLPPLTPEEQTLRKEARGGKGFPGEWRGEAASPDDLNIYYRCITRGVLGSMIPVVYNNGNEILQEPGYVIIRNEMIHETRVIPLDGRPHLPGTVRKWLGDSRGRWDGNTLVVDTTNFNDKTRFRGSDENLHVIERFTRVSPTMILYKFTIDDPTAFTKPWTGETPFVAQEGPVYEYACHEGNYAMVDILAGARAQEKNSGK